jgi:hypothetical protein
MEVLIFLLIFSFAVGYWANAWGRNGWGWGIAALILSPILTGLVLLIAGKTVEKKGEEAKRIKDIVG